MLSIITSSLQVLSPVQVGSANSSANFVANQLYLRPIFVFPFRFVFRILISILISHLIMTTVCYRNSASSLTVTDANLCLGRILPDYFPKIFGPTKDQSLDKETVCRVFDELALEASISLSGHLRVSSRKTCESQKLTNLTP